MNEASGHTLGGANALIIIQSGPWGWQAGWWSLDIHACLSVLEAVLADLKAKHEAAPEEPLEAKGAVT